MKTRLSREELRKAIEYHAGENHGLRPVLDTPQDLAEWTGYVLASLTGYSAQELADAGFGLTFEEDGQVVLAGDVAVMEAVRHYIL